MALAIKVEELSKTFAIRQVGNGFFGTVKSLIRPDVKEVQAIDYISFGINKGGKVAIIGRNGAGKSTTIKILTGILYPTAGNINVLGMVPWQKRQQLAYRIGTVFGQRSQLWHHLPPSDTFALLAKIYELDSHTFKTRLNTLVDRFELAHLIHTPVRQLSLGERMRCEIVASLLHNPEILFLDEPTIGLDINAKLMIRTLLNKLTEEYGTTLVLTSHDTADLEQVCDRVLILDKGTLILDSSINDLKRDHIRKKMVSLVTETPLLSLKIPGVREFEAARHQFCCEVDLNMTSVEFVIQQAMSRTNLKDVTIEDPSMEEIIRGFYATSR